MWKMFGDHYQSMPLYTRDKYIEIDMYTVQCVIYGSSRDALYWKMKMSRNSKHKTTCSTCLHIPQRLKQSVVLLRETHPLSPVEWPPMCVRS